MGVIPTDSPIIGLSSIYDSRGFCRAYAKATGIKRPSAIIHFGETGITAYLENGGTLERAQSMANHASTRTTQFYDRRSDKATLNDVERIRLG